jgi:hypothetical protein
VVQKRKAPFTMKDSREKTAFNVKQAREKSVFDIKESKEGLEKCITSFPPDTKRTIEWMIHLFESVLKHKESLSNVIPARKIRELQKAVPLYKKLIAESKANGVTITAESDKKSKR